MNYRNTIVMSGWGLVAVIGASLVAVSLASAAAGIETRQLAFSVTYVVNAAKTRYNHVYQGRCEVQSVGAEAYGLDGPTSAQSTADKAAREKAVDPGKAMAAEMQKCGSDMNCVANVMKKAQASGDLAKLQTGVTKASKTDANFTNWTVSPKGCSALTLTVDDKFDKTIQDDGEGGERTYVVTHTVKGSKPVKANFAGDTRFGIQHNLKTQVTEYRFGRPQSPGFPTTRQGNAPAFIMGSGDTPVTIFPDVIAFPAQPGGPKSGKIVTPVAGGSVTFEWTLTP